MILELSTMTYDASQHPADAGAEACGDLEEELARIRSERDMLRSRIERVAEAIGSDNPERIVHDVRNVLNELVLLRKLVELDDE